MKLAAILWFAETFENVYDATAPTFAPSTETVFTPYPTPAVIVKDLLDPLLTVMEPDGEIEPPVPALALIV